MDRNKIMQCSFFFFFCSRNYGSVPVLIECLKKKNEKKNKKNDSVNLSGRLSPVESQSLFSGAKTHQQILTKRSVNCFFNLK